jgi:hypothetical protein
MFFAVRRLVCQPWIRYSSACGLCVLRAAHWRIRDTSGSAMLHTSTQINQNCHKTMVHTKAVPLTDLVAYESSPACLVNRPLVVTLLTAAEQSHSVRALATGYL